MLRSYGSAFLTDSGRNAMHSCDYIACCISAKLVAAIAHANMLGSQEPIRILKLFMSNEPGNSQTRHELDDLAEQVDSIGIDDIWR